MNLSDYDGAPDGWEQERAADDSPAARAQAAAERLRAGTTETKPPTLRFVQDQPTRPASRVRSRPSRPYDAIRDGGRQAREEATRAAQQPPQHPTPGAPLWLAVLLIPVGIAAVYFLFALVGARLLPQPVNAGVQPSAVASAPGAAPEPITRPITPTATLPPGYEILVEPLGNASFGLMPEGEGITLDAGTGIRFDGVRQGNRCQVLTAQGASLWVDCASLGQPDATPLPPTATVPPPPTPIPITPTVCGEEPYGSWCAVSAEAVPALRAAMQATATAQVSH